MSISPIKRIYYSGVNYWDSNLLLFGIGYNAGLIYKTLHLPDMIDITYAALRFPFHMDRQLQLDLRVFVFLSLRLANNQYRILKDSATDNYEFQQQFTVDLAENNTLLLDVTSIMTGIFKTAVHVEDINFYIKAEDNAAGINTAVIS